MVEKFDRAVEGILLPLVCLVGVLGAVIINNSIIKTHFNTLWFRNSYKCKEIERNAGKCKEIQRNVEKYREMQRNSEKCREMQRNSEKCGDMQRNTEKFREMQRNAADM